jgi:hypothetical protein
MKTWRMRITFWIPKAKNTHSDYVIHTVLKLYDGCTNVSQYYVIRTLPVLFHIEISHTLYAEKLKAGTKKFLRVIKSNEIEPGVT